MFYPFSPDDPIRYSEFLTEAIAERLEIFRSEIEKSYFTKILIRITSYSETSIELGVEFQSNFWLSEAVNYFKNSNPLYSQNIFQNAFTSFNTSLEKLRRNCALDIDISELSIYFKETAVVIGKVYKNSIPENYESIITLITKRLGTLITDNLELPTEIYLPLLSSEDEYLTKEELHKSYFGFWGVYYDAEEDAVLYDVEKNTMLKGDLFLVEHLIIMENL